MEIIHTCPVNFPLFLCCLFASCLAHVFLGIASLPLHWTGYVSDIMISRCVSWSSVSKISTVNHTSARRINLPATIVRTFYRFHISPDRCECVWFPLRGMENQFSMLFMGARSCTSNAVEFLTEMSNLQNGTRTTCATDRFFSCKKSMRKVGFWMRSWRNNYLTRRHNKGVAIKSSTFSRFTYTKTTIIPVN